MTRLLVLTILLATLLSGCARNRFDDKPKRPDFMSTSAAGKRVVINDHNGQPTLKIRTRKNAWKVYDENFQATGFVRWPEQAAPHVENLVREKLAQFQSVGSADEVFELPDLLRIEKIEAGWAVFNQDAELLGLFERESPTPTYDTDSDLLADTPLAQDETEESPDEADLPISTTRWTFRSGYNTPVLWTASQENHQIIARHQNGKTHSSNAAHFSAPAMLAAELTDLSALERAALAAWFMHMMPEA